MKLNKYIQKYNSKGFVIIKNLLKKKTILNLLNEVEIVKKKISKHNQVYFHKTKDGKFNTIHNIQKFHKTGHIIELTQNKKILRIIKNLIKGNVKLRNIEFFLKPAFTGMPSPFHQDNFYWNIIGAKALNIWIACTNSSKKNGGLCYLSDSHKLGLVKHQISYAKGSSQKIPDEILKKLNFKRIFPVLKTGDCLIHHPEIIHGSFKNKSKNDRIGIVLSYMNKNSKFDKEKLKIYKSNLQDNLKKIYK